MVSVANRAYRFPTQIERPADFHESDDLGEVPVISLEEFYSTVADFTLTDEEALEFMSFSARMSMLKFENDAEILSFKGDFQAALAFIGKLDEVDTKGEEPLGNVLEYYGGNEHSMINSENYRADEDQTVVKCFKKELKKMNKHYKNGYVVFNRAKTENPHED